MNILLVLVDQWRADCLGMLGKIPVKTPNLDKLASEGVLFENAFTPTPVCAPARQSLLSGRQPDSFGALWNYGLAGVASLTSDGDYWTKNLKKAGYSNGYFGQWHASQTAGATEFGYDVYVSEGDVQKDIPEKYGNIEYKNGWFGEPSPIDYHDALPHRLAKATADWIEKQTGQWHAWLDISKPHLPCRPSEPFSSMYKPEYTVPWDSFGDTLENKPIIQKKQIKSWHLENMTWADFAPTAAMYYGMISQIDDALGELFRVIEKKGQLDDTVIVFTSDHGDTSGGHGMMDKHYILYDDVTHVPLIVRYPKAFAKGERRKEFVSNCLDFAPTIEQLCKLEPAGKRHGMSLVDILNGKNPENFTVSTSNGQQFGLFTQRSIRTEKYKYIWNLTDKDEFYDLTLDPGEKVNRVDCEEYAEIQHEMKHKLREKLHKLDDPFCSWWVEWQLE